jgi:hypothetical protein
MKATPFKTGTFFTANMTNPATTISTDHNRLSYSIAFLTPLVPGGVLLAVKCALEGRLHCWFAGVFGILATVCVAASLVAKTEAWVRFATTLMR